MDKLLNKVAVITGSTRGLGIAFARAFAAEGAAVVITSRRSQDVAESVRILKSEGFKAEGTAADVTDLQQVERLAEFAAETFGKFDIWVNNAGVAGPYGPTVDVPVNAFEQVLDTNIMGTYYGSRTAMKHFIQRKSGKLINLLGHGWKAPVAYQNAYSSSKAWVRWFTLSLAKETEGTGVGVFAYNPGMVMTELLTNVDVIQGNEHRLKVFPTIIRLLAKPAELPAQKLVWLVSSATDGQTGKIVSYSSTGGTLATFAKEGLRKLMGRKVEPVDVKMKVIPPG